MRITARLRGSWRTLHAVPVLALAAGIAGAHVHQPLRPDAGASSSVLPALTARPPAVRHLPLILGSLPASAFGDWDSSN